MLLKGFEENSKEKPVEFTFFLGFVGKEKISLKIERKMRCFEVCREISKKIGLISWLDFKLFMVNPTKKEELLLDDEEFLLKSMEFIEEKEANFFEKISLNLRKIKKIVLNSEYIVVFKKNGFFEENAEISEMSHDPRRLALIFHQCFQEVLEGKYDFHLMDYLFTGCIKLYTIYHKYPKDFRLNYEMIKEVLPLSIVKSKEKNLEGKLKVFWQDLSTEIDLISSENSEKNTENSEKNKENKKNSREKQIKIAQKLLISFLQREKLFGTTLFWVSLLKKEKNSLKNAPDFVWLNIKNNSVSVLHPSEKTLILLEIQMEDIVDFAIYPNCLKIRIFNEKKYRFSTNKSFEIAELLRKYRGFINKNLEKT